MSRLISQLRHNITKYNLLLWQLRGATGGGQTDFVLQDKSDFVLQEKSDFFSLARFTHPHLLSSVLNLHFLVPKMYVLHSCK